VPDADRDEHRDGPSYRFKFGAFLRCAVYASAEVQGRALFRRFVLAAALLLAAGACASRESATSTPLPRDDFSFEALLEVPKASPSPSVSPEVDGLSASTGSSGSSSSAGGRSSAPQAAAPAGRVSCPSGRVTADITDLNSNDDGISATGRQKWDVQTSGTARNGTSAAVRSIRMLVKLSVDDSDPQSETVLVSQAIGPGTTINWRSRSSFRGSNEPDEGDAQVFVTGWSYADQSLDSCPT
jgi:hypothetical protein